MNVVTSKPQAGSAVHAGRGCKLISSQEQCSFLPDRSISFRHRGSWALLVWVLRDQATATTSKRSLPMTFGHTVSLYFCFTALEMRHSIFAEAHLMYAFLLHVSCLGNSGDQSCWFNHHIPIVARLCLAVLQTTSRTWWACQKWDPQPRSHRTGCNGIPPSNAFNVKMSRSQNRTACVSNACNVYGRSPTMG